MHQDAPAGSLIRSSVLRRLIKQNNVVIIYNAIGSYDRWTIEGRDRDRRDFYLWLNQLAILYRQLKS